ncbi:carboxypeptidase-like regulatory domain-containing protein [Xenorhabdus szentirmaii]|uniref:Lipoprotein n=1 Tax=Xenorhabdus szentirmaii DSM 16338 TaxID=1427518 RepID=W1ISA2_9GAMM|nr:MULTISPECIES: carboxypeptidase-like regulatory domain-containing protein [Xenorhabdus]MBD2781867.1 hypothetical protein [Xenorhabdus sp. 38]MBD2793126.1 hypothetical protein [Xenorhabdus sp. CUL]MBD2806404.1 hypothetical protein [Xenorhabdus sp. ZM]MBD2822141.1 hypothetical protein [Xenorhabdus sp. 42]MBD2826135.1 hypothetical protein [Xenorhabdus sp. 5]
MKKSIYRLTIAALCFALSGCIVTTRTITSPFSGQIIDRETNKPIANVTIHSTGFDPSSDKTKIETQQSDDNGKFHFKGINKLVVYPLFCCAYRAPDIHIHINDPKYGEYSDSIDYSYSYLKKNVIIYLPQIIDSTPMDFHSTTPLSY